jgi:hypothetical protein
VVHLVLVPAACGDLDGHVKVERNHGSLLVGRESIAAVVELLGPSTRVP